MKIKKLPTAHPMKAPKIGINAVNAIKIPIKRNGSNGGHNGLGHIQQLIGQNYARQVREHPSSKSSAFCLGRKAKNTFLICTCNFSF